MHDREEERKMTNKFNIFMFGLLELVKVSRIKKVDLAIEYQGDVVCVCKLFAILSFVFLGAASLNLPHPY